MQIIIVNRQKKIPVSKKRIKEIALKTLKFLNVKPVRKNFSKGVGLSDGVNLTGEIVILYTDNRSIQELNSRFLGRDRPTDVLCFDLSEGGKLKANIAISTEMARENARLFKTSPEREAQLYLIHGILHLFGWRDRTRKERERMQRKALQILNKTYGYP